MFETFETDIKMKYNSDVYLNIARGTTDPGYRVLNFLLTEFASFFAREITHVMDSIHGSVVPLVELNFKFGTGFCQGVSRGI